MSDTSAIQVGANGEGAVAEVKCPLCDQVIPHEHFDEIHGRIQERQRAQRQDADAHLRAEVERARDEVAEEARKDWTLREAALRAEAKAEGETSAAEKIAAVQKARDEAIAELERAKTAHNADIDARLKEQREALATERERALNSERSRSFEENQKVQQQLEKAQRELQRMKSSELGEGAEVNLYEALRHDFPDDKISRVKKGEEGADILQRVLDTGDVCGLIIYDSKNRKAWRDSYVEKLRDDKIAEGADVAVLATSVFPAGTRQLHVDDGIIIANPARVVALAAILRRHIIQLHSLRLTNEDRDEKMACLYDFVTSERCTALFDQIENLANELEDLDVKETKSHKSVWLRRGTLIRSVHRVHGELTAEFDHIVGRDAGTSGLAVL